MVEHIVLFKLKPESTPEQEQELIKRLHGLKDKISSVVTLTAGKTFTERGLGYTVGLVVRFNSRDDLAAYGPHPDHVLIKEYIGQVCDSALIIDYDC